MVRQLEQATCRAQRGRAQGPARPRHRPHTEWLDDGGIRAHPTYGLAGWHPEAPWWGPFVRRRVGMRNHPLADMLNAFIGAGLAIERVAELGDRPIPVNLAIRARKQVTVSPLPRT